MGKKQGGANTKVEAAKAKKAVVKATKDAAKSAADAAAESADWANGADTRAERKRQEEERKRVEQEAKKAEKQKLLAMEEHALEEDKHAIRKQKKTVKPVATPWEEALKPAVKKNNRGSKKPSSFGVNGGSSEKLTQAEMVALREAEEARIAGKIGKKAIKFENTFQANKNRNQDEPTEARSLDAALDLLSVGDKEGEKHPERRAKAAYKTFESVMLPQLKEDYPGLKLSQYKHKLSELWRRSPDNPLNQETLAYNAKKQRKDDENLQPRGHEDSAQLQQMLTSCMINRQILCCLAGVLIGIPISIQRKSYKPFAILGVLGSFVDYSVPYTNDCRRIYNSMQLSLQQETQRNGAKPSSENPTVGR